MIISIELCVTTCTRRFVIEKTGELGEITPVRGAYLVVRGEMCVGLSGRGGVPFTCHSGGAFFQAASGNLYGARP
jgi:hypothetical protein